MCNTQAFLYLPEKELLLLCRYVIYVKLVTVTRDPNRYRDRSRNRHRNRHTCQVKA